METNIPTNEASLEVQRLEDNLNGDQRAWKFFRILSPSKLSREAPTRISVAQLLLHGTTTSRDVASTLGITQQLACHHLTNMIDEDLVEISEIYKRGNVDVFFYKLKENPINVGVSIRPHKTPEARLFSGRADLESFLLMSNESWQESGNGWAAAAAVYNAQRLAVYRDILDTPKQGSREIAGRLGISQQLVYCHVTKLERMNLTLIGGLEQRGVAKTAHLYEPVHPNGINMGISLMPGLEPKAYVAANVPRVA